MARPVLRSALTSSLQTRRVSGNSQKMNEGRMAFAREKRTSRSWPTATPLECALTLKECLLAATTSSPRPIYSSRMSTTTRSLAKKRLDLLTTCYGLRLSNASTKSCTSLICAKTHLVFLRSAYRHLSLTCSRAWSSSAPKTSIINLISRKPSLK